MSTRKNLYDVALNGQGLILANNPEQPRITATQDAVYGQRFAQGDLSYNDLAKYWFQAQTDWSGGITSNPSFKDDAKFYFSTNLDAFSEPGVIKLALAQDLYATLDEEIICIASGYVNSALQFYLGTADNASSGQPKLYRYNAGFTAIKSFNVGQGFVSHVFTRLNYVWALTTGGTTSEALTISSDNSTFTDLTGYFNTTATITATNFRCAVQVGTTAYIFGDEANTGYAICKTTVAAPGSSDFTLVACIKEPNKLPISACYFSGSIYYLLRYDGVLELRRYDIDNAVDLSVYTFNNTAPQTDGMSDKLLHVLASEMVITVPGNPGYNSIWTLDLNGNLVQRYIADTLKLKNNQEAYEFLACGGTIFNNRIYWGNLIYDGTNFYNWIKPSDDSVSGKVYPLGVVSSTLYMKESANTKKLYFQTTTTYKGASAKNYVIFGNIDVISSIDKLGVYVEILFDALTSGQTFTVEYTTSPLSSSTSWTSLGTASHTTDGAITGKRFFLGDAVVGKKFWFRVGMETTSTTSSPRLNDIIFAYLPAPDLKLRWQFTVKCEDAIFLKDQTNEVKDGLWLRNMLRKAWLTKSILSFEDYDSFTEMTLLSAITASSTTLSIFPDTDLLPEQGNLLIENEIVSYTGKTRTTITGLTRGTRGTNAVSHVMNTAVTLGYRVIIKNYQESLIIANHPNKAEYLVTLELAEV